jgi:hypothetical protein
MWMVIRFGVCVEDGIARTALCGACSEGHLGVAVWLAVTFGLTAKDVRARDNAALRWACNGGHLDVASWLVASFGLSTEDMWDAAADADRADVVIWLSDQCCH